MSRIDNFKRQHDELLTVVGQLGKELDANRLKENAGPVRTLLAQLAGKLKVHLKMEDEVLYPELLKHQDAKVQATARRFSQEMGGIAQAFGNYCSKWPSPQAIQANPDGFISETNQIFQALGKRVEQENSQLYTLL